MDQTKIGGFLKELRKEKNLTQEQFAEHLGVSGRTVSRWETGSNMPDISLLAEIAEFFDVNIPELIDGERKSEKMKKETKEAVLQAVDYVNSETERHNRHIRIMLLIGMIFWLVSSLIKHTVLSDNRVLNLLSEFSEGAGIGMIFCGLVFNSRYGQKLKAFKMRLLRQSDKQM